MLTIASLVLAALAELMPPASVQAKDAPNDQGQSMVVTWAAAEGETAGITGYRILRSTSPDSGSTELGVIATLFCFYFSREHRGALGAVSRVGVVFIMVAFGASFGYTVMARISLLIGRFYFLLHDCLPIIR